jgi:hypothetical protein
MILNKEIQDLTKVIWYTYILPDGLITGCVEGAAGNLSRQVTVRDRVVCVNGNTNVFLVLSILIWNTVKGTAFYRALYTSCVRLVIPHGIVPV